MKKTYKIEVDCANCAKPDGGGGPNDCRGGGGHGELYDQKMTVEFADGADERAVMQADVKACKRVEPDCEIEV